MIQNVVKSKKIYRNYIQPRKSFFRALSGFYRAATWNGFLIVIENTILSFFTYILYTPDDITNREDYKSSLSVLREIQKNDEIEKETNEVKIDDKEDSPAV